MKGITFLASFLLVMLAHSQNPRFDEGYIVTKTGDTLNGWVHWKKDAISTDNLQFKKNETDPAQEYTWDELTDAYNRNTKQFLKISSVLRHYEYIDGYDYMIRNKDSVGWQVIPLKQVYKGHKLSLYLYYENSPFYFIYDGKQMKQLVQKYRYTNMMERMFDYEKGRRFHITDVYLGTLAAYYDFEDDNKMRYMLNNTLYEQGSLKSLISKMDKKLR